MTTLALKAVPSTQFQSLSVTSLYFIALDHQILFNRGSAGNIFVIDTLRMCVGPSGYRGGCVTQMVGVQNMTQGIFKALFWTQTVSDLYLCSKHRII